MRIQLEKFGDILTSREAGKEAFSAFLPTLHSLGENEKIIIDFQGVSVLTPSWADEFIRSILWKYPQKVSFINDTNASVQAALRFANPKLNLSEMRVFGDKIVFDEITDDTIYNSGRVLQILIFPYSDEEALRVLTDNEVKKISVHPVDHLSDSRLKAVIQMLNQAGIETMVS